MWTKKAIIGAVLAAALIAYSHYEYWSDISYTQNYLRLYASSIYEYHALTGEWPTKIDDLAKTSLSVKYPHWWKTQLETGADVIVWPKNLKSDPKGNGHAILVYHNKGLDAEEGRMWVCWGDLRTEWITPRELKEHLNNQKKVEEPMDAKLVGVWQNRSDAREFWTFRADGTVRWFYQGVPAIGISDSIMAYNYRADLTKSPAHLDVIHQGVLGTSCFIYEVTRDELHIGNRPVGFGPKDMYYKRVLAEPAQ